jgi:hypothetical protein
MLVAAYGIGPEFVFMNNNARVLVACITRAVLQEPDIQEIEWPAVSPNLNPIEHVWDRLNRRICGHPVPTQTLQDIKQALTEEWNLIPQCDLCRACHVGAKL